MKKLLNDGWSFTKLPNGSQPEDALGASFTPVDIPHDWLIWQPNDLYESADAWYRRNLEYQKNASLPVTILRFDGVYMDCDIILNGEVIATHPYGYTAFDVLLTGLLREGNNELMVHIRHLSPNSRWYSGSGIFRDVYFIELPEDHMVPHGMIISETEADTGIWRVSVQAEIAGSSYRPFYCILSDASGKTIARTEGICSGNQAKADLEIPEAHLWGPEDPYLYSLITTYGEQTEVCKIGIRSVLLDSERGFILNGRRIKLKGVCLHHDLGALGAAFHPKAARRQLKLMKEMGANAIRTSHNPPASGFLDLCDEMGLLVVDEAFDMWERSKTTYDYARFFDDWAQRDIASWVRRDRCHPCVVMWSIGNEIYDMHADQRGTEVTRMLAEEVRKHDPVHHAFTTFGCNYMPWEGGQRCAAWVDAVGYNYGEKYYDRHHLLHPQWKIYGSETASVLSSRGVYHFPIEQSIMAEADQQCSALGNSNTSWGADNLSRMIIEDIHNPYSMGQFLWSGIDYIGEPTPYHTRSCYFGQADTACYPKDSYYLFQSFWTDRKMIHIGVSWDWNPDQLIDIPVMTNCRRTELLLNGVSQGIISVDPDDPERCLPVWKIPFTPGILTARGMDEKGNILCEDRRLTPGEPRKIALSCEEEFLLGDCHDLIFVTVSAVDEHSVPVDNARDRVKISVSGGGYLTGTDNGDSTDPDGYKCDCRRLFNGKLLLMIGSNGSCEPVHITVKGDRCQSAELFVPVRRCEPVQGVSCHQRIPEYVPDDHLQARKLEITRVDSAKLSPEHPECSFRYSVIPSEASERPILWQVTNQAGIESPFVSVAASDQSVTVKASADGSYYLRGLVTEPDQTVLISQLEFSAEGFGCPALNPYSYISAGLYDIYEGEIGTGNEKGIAFARDGESMIGFSLIDFGKTGSNVLTADIFALHGDPYDMELWVGEPGEKPAPVSVLHYEKPSIWNVYQPETWTLPERLTGLKTVCFRMKDKVHMKGFVFEKQSYAYIRHQAADAETIYGDNYRIEGSSVTGIGNNVTLTWTDMDFGGKEHVKLCVSGSTPLPVNTIHIRLRNELGETISSVAEFFGGEQHEQFFSVRVPSGNCTVSFVFLPGSAFDFHSFCFGDDADCWTEKGE